MPWREAFRAGRMAAARVKTMRKTVVIDKYCGTNWISGGTFRPIVGGVHVGASSLIRKPDQKRHQHAH